MKLVYKSDQIAYERDQAEYEKHKEIFDSLPEEDREGVTLVEPDEPFTYEATEVEETTEVETVSGKVVALPGTYIVEGNNITFVVHKDDIDNPNLWVKK